MIPDGFDGMSDGFVVFKRDEIRPHVRGDGFPQIMVAQFSRHYVPFRRNYAIKLAGNTIIAIAFFGAIIFDKQAKKQ